MSEKETGKVYVKNSRYSLGQGRTLIHDRKHKAKEVHTDTQRRKGIMGHTRVCIGVVKSLADRPSFAGRMRGCKVVCAWENGKTPSTNG